MALSVLPIRLNLTYTILRTTCAIATAQWIHSLTLTLTLARIQTQAHKHKHTHIRRTHSINSGFFYSHLLSAETSYSLERFMMNQMYKKNGERILCFC